MPKIKTIGELTKEDICGMENRTLISKLVLARKTEKSFLESRDRYENESATWLELDGLAESYHRIGNMIVDEMLNRME